MDFSRSDSSPSAQFTCIHSIPSDGAAGPCSLPCTRAHNRQTLAALQTHQILIIVDSNLQWQKHEHDFTYMSPHWYCMHNCKTGSIKQTMHKKGYASNGGLISSLLLHSRSLPLAPNCCTYNCAVVPASAAVLALNDVAHNIPWKSPTQKQQGMQSVSGHWPTGTLSVKPKHQRHRYREP